VERVHRIQFRPLLGRTAPRRPRGRLRRADLCREPSEPRRRGGPHRFVRGDVCDQKAPSAHWPTRGSTRSCTSPPSPQQPGRARPGPFLLDQCSGDPEDARGSTPARVDRFHHISTCEVYGDLDLDTDERFTEDSPYRPRTPYNASKAGLTTRCRPTSKHSSSRSRSPTAATITDRSNSPKRSSRCSRHMRLTTDRPLYASTKNRREWLHVRDHCRRSRRCSSGAKWGDYHVGSGVEASIEEIADVVLSTLGKPSSLKEMSRTVRPRRRYLLDSSKIERLLVGARGAVRRGPGRNRRVVRHSRSWWEHLVGPSPGGRGRLGTTRLVGPHPSICRPSVRSTAWIQSNVDAGMKIW